MSCEARGASSELLAKLPNGGRSCKKDVKPTVVIASNI